MKKTLSALLSIVIAAGSLSMPSVIAADALLKSDFESGTDGWTAHGTASVEQTTVSAASGTGALAVTNRQSGWCGAEHALDTSVIQPGKSYSFSASVMQKETPLGVHFKLTVSYSNGGGGMFAQPEYGHIAEGDAAAGYWTELKNASFEIPAGATNPVLFIETEDSSADFYLDSVIIAEAGAVTEDFALGDANHSGSVDTKDAGALMDFLLTKKADGVFLDTSDFDGDGVLTAKDLTLLKAQLKNPPVVKTTTATTTVTTTTETTASSQQTDVGEHAKPKEYMAKVRSDMATDVPGNVKANNTGSMKKIYYHSNKANRDKPANVWVPKGYDTSKKYCVLYMNHGVMGNEDNMTKDWGVTEMASYFIDSGEVPPFIIVFPQMYTDPGAATPGFNFNMEMMDHYDDFFYDLTESLMPYIEKNYSIKTGKENTAIAGFSMGGRESLYCTISAPDKFGYCAAASPAPGIVPASDKFITNHLGSYIPGTNQRMKDGDFKISDDKLPYLLMIAGGTNDSVVGNFPETYHNLFTQNGTDHIWTSVPGADHDNRVGIPLFYNFFRYLFKA